MSDISKFYAGKTVLISGATGFMGKVLLERMLSTLPDVKKIYLLMRPKKGLTIEQRIKLMLSQAPFTFNNIPDKQFVKIYGIQADFNKSDMALSEEDKGKIVNEVSVVIHMAANVRFDLNLKNALMQNTLATKTLLEFCTKIKELLTVVYVSTTYCNVDIHHNQEKVYDIGNLNVYSVLELVLSNNDYALTEMTKDIIKLHPNTYTFSKRLAEIVARDMGNKLPLCIARPSIVTSALTKPCMGWVDSLTGPLGLLSAMSMGVLRIVYADLQNKPDLIPVDCAINGIIAASWNRTLQKNTGGTIFNLTLPEKNKVTWKYFIDHYRTAFYKYPQKRIFWYPRVHDTTNYFIYALVTIFCQVLPAAILDIMLVIFRQKPFLLKMQKRLYNAGKLMRFFHFTKFNFETTNTQNLFNSLCPEDRKTFYGINNVVLDYKYFENTYLSVRNYCFNDDGKSSFRYVQLKIFFVLDALWQMTVLCGIFFVIFRIVGLTWIRELDYWF